MMRGKIEQRPRKIIFNWYSEGIHASENKPESRRRWKLQAEVLFQSRREKSDADSRLPEFHAQLTSWATISLRKTSLFVCHDIDTKPFWKKTAK